MRLIIAGSRSGSLGIRDIAALDAIHRKHCITQVVSGGADGVDSAGEAWAESRGIPVRVFPANWAVHGRRAGPVRNAIMACNADAAVLFPGGRGTANMHQQAVIHGLIVFNYMQSPPFSKGSL